MSTPFASLRVTALSAGSALALMLTVPALAQSASPQTPPPAQSQPDDSVAALLRAKGEAYSRAPDSEQNPDEVRTTQALNAEVTARNDLAASQESADQQAYAEAVAGAEVQGDVDYGAAQMRYEADVKAAEEARLRYEAAMADWQATVAACQAGDSARCHSGQTMAIPR